MMLPWPLQAPGQVQGTAGAGPGSCRIPEWAGVRQRCRRRLPSAALGCGGKQPPAAEAEAAGLHHWGPPPRGSPGVRGKLAVPGPELGLIVDLAASPFVPQRSSQTDSSLLPSSLGKGGM